MLTRRVSGPFCAELIWCPPPHHSRKATPAEAATKDISLTRHPIRPVTPPGSTLGYSDTVGVLMAIVLLVSVTCASPFCHEVPGFLGWVLALPSLSPLSDLTLSQVHLRALHRPQLPTGCHGDSSDSSCPELNRQTAPNLPPFTPGSFHN